MLCLQGYLDSLWTVEGGVCNSVSQRVVRGHLPGILAASVENLESTPPLAFRSDAASRMNMDSKV